MHSVDFTDLYSPRALGRAYVQFIANGGYTHALTLNMNREIALASLSRFFGAFCLEMDRENFGRKNVQGIASSERFSAIAFPEHLNSNIHLHASVRLKGWMSDDQLTRAEQILLHHWKKVSRGSGTICLKPLTNECGWPSYYIKEAARNGFTHLNSRYYHAL